MKITRASKLVIIGIGSLGIIVVGLQFYPKISYSICNDPGLTPGIRCIPETVKYTAHGWPYTYRTTTQIGQYFDATKKVFTYSPPDPGSEVIDDQALRMDMLVSAWILLVPVCLVLINRLRHAHSRH